MIFHRSAKGSIYRHLSRHRPAAGERPGPEWGRLPDQGEGTVHWAPGAWDGVLTHHWAGDADQAEVERVLAAVLSGSADDAEQALDGVSVISLVDELLPRVREQAEDHGAVYRLAYRLATRSAGREPVKLGITLLGLFNPRHHRDELRLLARHDEFTLFAMVALGTLEDAEREWWDLAREVTGWGRIHLVNRLADTRDPAIRAWILREGFRNDVADDYLAVIAANTGDLAGALAGPVDDELFRAARDLLVTLCTPGGPVDGMTSVTDGRRAAELFLDLLADRPTDGADFAALAAIRDHASEHWPDLTPRAEAIMARPEWADHARAGLDSPDLDVFHRAAAICAALGIPVRDAYLTRLADDPLDPMLWYQAVTGSEGDAGLAPVLGLAAKLLPLDAIASGPEADAPEGLGGERFAPHRALDTIVQFLDRHPGMGWPLIATALRSPGPRNRRMAAKALAAWDRADWPDGAADLVARARADEPDPEIRARLGKLIDGAPAPDHR